MSKVTVYRWRKYDIVMDENQKSRRWATLDAIERACGEPLDYVGCEIDEADLDPAMPGMTPRGWKPPLDLHGGAQRQAAD